ncbi:MAG: aldehyde ferredoxin oxidoreductase family protein [Nanoarchaeota archaeon]|nr:aldehyde ferredoxin oxidoreductase family protein [Nanoarchaeota archaeon]
MKGYAGEILRVNLSTKEVKKEKLDENLARIHLGGRGLATRIAYDEIPSDADPLSPGNKLIMASGPLSGTRVPASGKTDFVAKSPLTGGYGSSNVGGHLAEEMKFAGYDAIIIEGASDKPCYLYIDDDKVEVRDASQYWGLGSITGEKKFKDDLGNDFQIAVIGPAAENLVKYSCISHDFGRNAGRAGMGTVMGGKKLKAIAMRGSKSLEVHDKQALDKVVKTMFEECMKHPELKAWQIWGTSGVTKWCSSTINAFPTKNFSMGHFEHDEKLRAEVMREKMNKHGKACGMCPMACGQYSYSKKHNITVEGPEYETIALMGGNLGITDIEDVAYLNYVADELGLDTISTGNIVAHVIEAYKKGKVTDTQLDGLKLDWNATSEIAALMDRIAHRRGFGNLLANGVKYVSKILGTEEYAMHVKGTEISGYESRRRGSMKLAYGTCNVGGHHNDAWAITYDVAKGDKKAEKVIELQHIRPGFDALGACRLPWVELGIKIDYYLEALNAITGFNFSMDDLMKAYERNFNLMRMFWVKHVAGFDRKQDQVPERWYKEEESKVRPDEPIVSKKEYNELLDKYYKLRGWTKKGVPSKKKLKALGLDFAIKDLKREK